ncbi:MAG: hypothetical protein JNM68_16550 [Dinghuibacter sp.]|nr:hypothetical protein [Dinghuibacter sp.]
MKKNLKKISVKKKTIAVLNSNNGQAVQGGITGRSCMFCSRYPLICD